MQTVVATQRNGNSSICLWLHCKWALDCMIAILGWQNLPIGICNLKQMESCLWDLLYLSSYQMFYRFSLISRPNPSQCGLLSVSHVGKEGLVTFVTFSCSDGMCTCDISHANKQRCLNLPQSLVLFVLIQLYLKFCCLPMSSMAAEILPFQGVVTYTSPVEAFATGIKVESSDQRYFLNQIKGSRRILSD